MAEIAISQVPFTQKLQARLRRFWRWLSNPKVVLSLIMLFLMFYMVVVPLYRMVATTVTYQQKDVFRVPTAEVGKLTLFHYQRMILSKFSKPYLYDPLLHSITISIGATVLALGIGGSLAWMCIRTDMTGRTTINQLAVLPYIMPGWTMAAAWSDLADLEDRLAAVHAVRPTENFVPLAGGVKRIIISPKVITLLVIRKLHWCIEY